MIRLLSILVSPKKLKSLGFLKYFPSFWFPYKTIYSNKKYTYCFKVFGISASTRNVSSFRVQIPLTASLDISFSDLVFPFCCCNHRFDSSLSDSLKCFVCTTQHITAVLKPKSNLLNCQRVCQQIPSAIWPYFKEL